MRHTTAIVPALIGLVLGLGAAHWLAPARAQEQAWTGGRWEYRVFVLNPADYQEKADYKRVLEQYDGDGRRADPAFQDYVLDYLGEEGWELVALERRFPTQLHLYLKRPAR